MVDQLKLQSVSVRALELPDATAQLGAIARREETPDLDTEQEFKAAARYLEELRAGISQALNKTRPVPVPSEGTTVFAGIFTNERQGYQSFRYFISEGDKFQPEGGNIRSFADGTGHSEYYYDGHAEFGGFMGLVETIKLGSAVKLASDGEHVFALVENLTEDEESDYVAIRLKRVSDAMFGVYGDFEIVGIDSPEFVGVAGDNNLLLEDLMIVDGKVHGLYWSPETKTCLELPLATD